MNVDPRLLLPLLGVLALTILLTGPGLWSENWGWWWMRKKTPPRAGERQSR